MGREMAREEKRPREYMFRENVPGEMSQGKYPTLVESQSTHFYMQVDRCNEWELLSLYNG